MSIVLRKIANVLCNIGICPCQEYICPMVLSNVLRTMATTFPLVDTKHLDQSREEILEIQEMPSRAIIGPPPGSIYGEKCSRTLPQCNIIPGLCLTETRIPGPVMVTGRLAQFAGRPHKLT